MDKTKSFLLTTTLLLSMAFTFSCSGNDGGESTQGGVSVDYGGETYETVAIGTQTWFKRNLNYSPSGGNSWCYSEIQANCAKYGRLYDWATAMAACPSGWHLPSNADWDELIDYAGGSFIAGAKLKATEGWLSYEGEGGNGTNDHGFSALPGGCLATIDPYGGCLEAGYGGHWWSADEYDSIAAYYQGISFYEYTHQGYRGKEFGFSVRCLKD